jgi:hypothetical protein
MIEVTVKPGDPKKYYLVIKSNATTHFNLLNAATRTLCLKGTGEMQELIS